MARRRKKTGRGITGILLVDKPFGISSNQTLQQVKRLFDANKAGHTGSLDVPATGMLPVCLGEATKVSGFLLDADKSYRVAAKLGIATSTGDAKGEPIQTLPFSDLEAGTLRQVIDGFLGVSKQVPPMFSALKHQGRRLYELAYQGIEVERQARPVRIEKIDIVAVEKDCFELQVRCSKGTYMRSLIQDIGLALNTCAHVTALRRISSGPFQEAQMHSLVELESLAATGTDALDVLLLPMDSALLCYPEVRLDAQAILRLCEGQIIESDDLPIAGYLRVYGPLHEFIGLGEVTEDRRLKPKRLINRDVSVSCIEK